MASLSFRNSFLPLACAGEDYNARGSLLHAHSGRIRKEITSFSGGLLQVAEADNGDIYAVGFHRDDSTGDESAVMFKKLPSNLRVIV